MGKMARCLPGPNRLGGPGLRSRLGGRIWVLFVSDLAGDLSSGTGIFGRWKGGPDGCASGQKNPLLALVVKTDGFCGACTAEREALLAEQCRGGGPVGGPGPGGSLNWLAVVGGATAGPGCAAIGRCPAAKPVVAAKAIGPLQGIDCWGPARKSGAGLPCCVALNGLAPARRSLLRASAGLGGWAPATGRGGAQG